ncbi:MAG: sulfite exporter TauE/SafE family protein [Gammaproteobacteria bacterium]|nr:MAG: sulfite exporter TauE/SafE family protein [Gammaproteobacteria bacterium]
MEIYFLVALGLGLASTLHCVGMCGGIMGALTFGLPDEVRSHRLTLITYIAAYNLGRISSYTFAGVIAGLISATLVSTLSVENGHLILRAFASLVLIAFGLHLAGLFPKMQVLESIGAVVWRKLQPLTKKFFPVRTLWRAFGFGLIWGWLPCGLVYSALLWASSSGDPVSGGLYMFAFGLGTLPGVMTSGLMSSTLLKLSRVQNLRYGMAALMIIIGLSLFFMPHQHGDHSSSDSAHDNAHAGHMH